MCRQRGPFGLHNWRVRLFRQSRACKISNSKSCRSQRGLQFKPGTRTYPYAPCRMSSCNIGQCLHSFNGLLPSKNRDRGTASMDCYHRRTWTEAQPQWTVTIEEQGQGFNTRSITETLSSFQVNSPSHYTRQPHQQRSQQPPTNNFSGASAPFANLTQLRFIAGCDRKRDNDHHSTQCKTKTVILNTEDPPRVIK